MKNVIMLKALQIWTVALGVFLLWGIAVAIFNLITGNYTSTASFEF